MKYLLKLFPYLRPYWGKILLNLLLLLSLTGLSLIVPVVLRQVIDVGLSQRDAIFLRNAGLFLLGLGLLTAALSFAQRYLSAWIATHVGYDLRNRLYDHIQRLSFSYHDHAQSGQLISRGIEDVRAIQNFAADSLIQLIQLLVMSLAIIGLLITAHPRLAILSLLPLLPMAWMTTRFGQRVTELFYAVDYALGVLSTRLQENVNGVQVVRAFAREPYEIERFDQANREYYQARLKVIGEWSKVMPTTNLFIVISTVILLWLGGGMVMRGEMSIGELVAFNSYLLMLSAPVQQLTWLVNAAGEAEAGAQRVFEVLDTECEIRTPAQARVIQPLRGEVEFRHVSLRYSQEKRSSLEDVSFHVYPNQVVALVGPTGSGKTSIVNLIPRFYDVTEGQVLIDGYDVRTLDLATLRRQIGIVLQTSLLFSDTIRNNIAYGRPDASMDEIIAAAKAAQAHDFIMSFPQGYDTIVGERGVTLSGGQRQRIAIARALLLDPRILILDDSTSSVDTRTEWLIQQALERLMEGRTTFVIAHRVSTVRRADLILVLDQGRIVERGTHEELLARDGFYRRIYELQIGAEEGLDRLWERLEESSFAEEKTL
ncbi:MAG: ABC transporter ATP-binding protein [Anaerolineales bacterium]